MNSDNKFLSNFINKIDYGIKDDKKKPDQNSFHLIGYPKYMAHFMRRAEEYTQKN